MTLTALKSTNEIFKLPVESFSNQDSSQVPKAISPSRKLLLFHPYFCHAYFGWKGNLLSKGTCRWKRKECPVLKGLIRAKIYPLNALVDEQWELLLHLLNGKKGLIQVFTANFLPKKLILLEELLFVQTKDFVFWFYHFFRKDFVI